MKECQDCQTIIQNYVAGEVSHSELETLHRHCQSCPDCRRLVDIHIGLTRAGHEMLEPSDADFKSMREGVMARITREAYEADRRSARRRIAWWDLRSLFRVYPAAGVVASAVVVACAVMVGRWSVAAPRIDDGLLLREVNRQASMETGLDGYWDTPFSYDNVSARPLAGGKLDLSFDVCRHINVVTTTDSPLAKDVLLHAILSSAAMGSRMKAMDVAQQVADPDLAEALAFTLHNDPNLAVRLQALSVLTEYPYDATVRDAFLTTLRRDEAVQVRLLALEYLAKQRVTLETLREAINAADFDSNPAILQHAIELTGEQSQAFD